MRRISVKLILLLATVAASVGWGQPPTISSLQSSTSLGVPYDVTGITSGTNVSGGGFFLFVNSTAGDFVPANFLNVTWLDTSTNTTTPLLPPNGLVTTATQIIVFVPNALFATPVANPVSVTIVVHETGRTSNSATFTINPPLQAIQPLLPSGTLNQPYSANLFSGGTPPFSEGGVTNPANLPLGITSPFPSIAIGGTPTQTGVFNNIQTAATDFWGNGAGGTDTIEIVDVPTLTSVVPNASGTGAGDLTITVNGTNFVGPLAALPVPGSQVQWTAGGVTTTLATTFNNNTTQLTALVPSALLATMGVANVTVVQPGGAVSNALPFSVLAPTLSSVAPASVPAGSGGTILTVLGANFAQNPSDVQLVTSTVSLNGIALGTLFVDTGTLTATVPAGMLLSPIQYNVRVTNPGGTTTNILPFFVLAPTVTSLSTNSLPAGSAAFVLTVTGANYLAASQISFGAPPLPTPFVNGTSLPATVPAALLAGPKVASIVVTNPGGSVSAPAPFTVQPSLAITTTSLPPGSLSVGYTYTFTGTGGKPPYTWSASGYPLGPSPHPPLAPHPPPVAAARLLVGRLPVPLPRHRREAAVHMVGQRISAGAFPQSRHWSDFGRHSGGRNLCHHGGPARCGAIHGDRAVPAGGGTAAGYNRSFQQPAFGRGGGGLSRLRFRLRRHWLRPLTPLGR